MGFKFKNSMIVNPKSGCKPQEATKAYNSAKQRIPAVKYVGADSAAVRRYSDKSGNSDHYQREHAFTITPIVS